jgi:hypothetical protein
LSKASSMSSSNERLVAELERAGRDTTEALKLLANVQQWLELHTAHRDRLVTELASELDQFGDG